MFLIDTNVMSEIRRRNQAHPSVRDWAARQWRGNLHLSVVTILEAQLGGLSLRRRDSAQGDVFLSWVRDDLVTGFAERILPLSTEIALACAALHVPNRRPERDAWIAATALVHGLTVVTRNTRDFEGTGVRLLNPWEG